VRFGQPLQPVGRCGAFVHHDLIELWVLGGKCHESTYPVGKRRSQRRHQFGGVVFDGSSVLAGLELGSLPAHS
jgi:hypothetical protein